MSSKECEKIIDMAVEQGNASGPVEQHARHCAECAAILACLGWLKTQGSPTSSMQPSAGYLNSLESKLSISGTASAPLFSNKTLITLLVGAALTVAAITGILHVSSRENPDSKAATAASTTGNPGDPAQTDATRDAMKTSTVAPVLQFPSPADDVE